MDKSVLDERMRRNTGRSSDREEWKHCQWDAYFAALADAIISLALEAINGRSQVTEQSRRDPAAHQ